MRLYYQKKIWKIKELELGLTVEGFSFFEFTNVCFFLGIYECMYKAFLHVMKHYKMSKNLSENVFGTFSPLYGIYDRIRLLEVDWVINNNKLKVQSIPRLRQESNPKQWRPWFSP